LLLRFLAVFVGVKKTAGMGLLFSSWIVCWHILFRIGCATAAVSYNLSALAARQLSAVSVLSGLHERTPRLSILKHEASFDFFDAAGGEPASLDNSVFTANVLVRSERPILILEDLESDLEAISCSASTIDFTIASPGRMADVSGQLKQISDFIAVTSHLGCNEPDQRAPHR
jgi:Domain of unknown function (DUF7029)